MKFFGLIFRSLVVLAMGVACGCSAMHERVAMSPNIQANAGEAQTVTRGATVTLDGSRSQVGQAKNIVYTWTQDSGNPIQVQLSDVHSLNPTFSAPSTIGYYYFNISAGNDEFSNSSRVQIGIKNETILSFDNQMSLTGTGWEFGYLSLFSRNVWKTTLYGYYSNYTNTSLTTPEINLTNFLKPVLKFHHRFYTEDSYDVGEIQISTDLGTNWQTIATYKNEFRNKDEIISLEQFQGYSPIKVRFNFSSNDYGRAEGWTVYNIQVEDF